MDLDKIQSKIKTGNECLTFKQEVLGFTLLDFWKWNASDILSNATRGRFAEFIVATATNINTNVCRDEWGAFDLETPDGIKLEIKSASYLQSWFQKTFSQISFSTKASRSWDAATNIISSERKRQADVYVFCLLNHESKMTVDPLNLDQWEFYVLATIQLDNYTRSQHSITLKSLQKLTQPIRYDKLNDEIKAKYAQ